MKKLREEWQANLEKIRIDQMISVNEFCKQLGVNYLTYHKLIDPVIPPVSLTTMRKLRDYFNKLEEGK